MDDTNSAARAARQRNARAADTTANAGADDAKAAAGPREVEMPRAVHELRTGPDQDDKIDGGTIITDELAAEHDLDDDQLAKLLAAGAIELVDVLVR